MANSLKLKRRAAGGSAGAPASLLSGEVAYSEVDDVLYIGFGDNGSGTATSIIALAGKGSFVTIGTTQTVSGGKDFSVVPTISGSLSAGDNSSKVATTAFVQALIAATQNGLSWKTAVVVASQVNVTVASPGASIDSISLTAGDRVLLKAQTAGAENGIYVWNGAATPMTRALDADTATELLGATVMVERGTNADQQWTQTVDTITLGTTALTWAQVGGGTGGVTSVSNLGTGSAVGSGVAGSVLSLRSLIGTGVISVVQNTNDITLSFTGTLAYANGGTGADLSALTTGALVKKGASALAAAVVDTDYLGPSSIISGGTF